MPDTDEATGLLNVSMHYTYALDILDQYDHQDLETKGTIKDDLFQIDYNEAMSAIHSVLDKFGGRALFGNKKDDSFRRSLAAIYQQAELTTRRTLMMLIIFETLRSPMYTE